MRVLRRPAVSRPCPAVSRRQPAVPRRRAVLLAAAVGLAAAGMASASAVPAHNDPPPPQSTSDCSPVPAGSPPIVHASAPASLRSAVRHVVLAPRQRATVQLGLVQPAQELDAFFLEDNGTKSEFTHCAFQGGLMWAVAKLAHERNLRVGLGNFGDYTGFEEKQAATSSGIDIAQGDAGVYFLDSTIRRPDATFYFDVVDLGNAWAGGWHAASGDQGGLEALYQSVTGAGQTVAPGDPDNIPAGEGANFRAGAFPVVVMVAAQWLDSPSRTPGYPGPDFATVVAAARTHGVNVAGVWIDNTNNKEADTSTQYSGLADLRTLVTGSGTRTGSSLSCGTGHMTMPPGSPPLCVFVPPADENSNIGGSGSPAQLGPTLRNLVASLANPQAVSVAVLSGHDVVAHVSGGRLGVDILRAHSFTASVTVRCPTRLWGHVVPVRLGEFVAGQLRATTSFAVACRRPNAPPPVVPPQQPVSAVPAPANPPAGPAAAGQPNPPLPQAQPNPAPQQIPQGAAALGLSQEPDLIAEYATTNGQPPNTDDLFFATLAMTALAGAAVRWRTRTAVSHVR